MPRRPITRSNQHYYHIVARTNNKEPFCLSMNDIWQLTTKKLRELQLEFDLKIASFVLMHNHFHLLLLTPDEDIDRVMYFFMKDITRTIQQKSGRINRIFGGRYKGCVIENERYLLTVYKYIYRNPVAAGVTTRVQDYPYSLLNLRFRNPNELPVKLESISNELFIGSFMDELRWLNESFKQEEAENIKFGLKKTTFAYKKQRSTGREWALGK